MSLLTRLKERKLFQWALAYIAGGWVVLQVMDVLAEPLSLAPSFQLGVFVVVVAGFFVALVLAWYHGEKGRQRVSGPELVILSALLFCAGGVIWMMKSTRPVVHTPFPYETDDPRPSIAVLPLANIGGAAESQGFVDGMHSQIIQQLSRISALRLISRTSVLEYREPSRNLRRIGNELGVDYVLEGEVQRSRDRILLIAQLIDADTDTHVWSEQYERTLSVANLFEIQREMASSIAGSLQVELLPAEGAAIAEAPTQNLEAWDAYLLAGGIAGFVNTADLPIPTEYARRVDLLHRAVELDHDFGEAWAALALTYVLAFRADTIAPGLLEAARESLAHAQRLAANADETALAHGSFLYNVLRRFDDAIAVLQPLSTSAPVPVRGEAILEMQQIYTRHGRLELEVPLLEEALVSDPRSWQLTHRLVNVMTRLRRLDEALKYSDRLLELRPSDGDGAAHRAMAHLLVAGDTVAAREDLEAAGWDPRQQPLPLITGLGAHTVAYYTGDLEAELSYWLDQPPRPDRLMRIAALSRLAGDTARMVLYADSASAAMEDRLALRKASEGQFASPWPVTSAEHSLAEAHALLGEREEAISLSDGALATICEGEVEPIYYCNWLRVRRMMVDLFLGNTDDAVAALEILLPTYNEWVTPGLVRIDPVYDPLRDDARFQALLDRYRDGG